MAANSTEKNSCDKLFCNKLLENLEGGGILYLCIIKLNHTTMKKLLLLVALATMAFTANAQTPVKYHGEVDLGYSIGVGTFSTGRVNLHTIQGVQIGRYFSTGVGLGLDYYHEFYDSGELAIPIYLNMKGYLPVSEKVAPYFSFDIGAGIGATSGISGMSGLYLTPAIGIKAGKFKAQIGYNVQRVSEDGVGINMNAIQIKVGLMF